MQIARYFPICIGGERTCPPEDYDGESGYYNVLNTISDIANEDYEDMKRWGGQDWHPESFFKDLVKDDKP